MCRQYVAHFFIDRRGAAEPLEGVTERVKHNGGVGDAKNVLVAQVALKPFTEVGTTPSIVINGQIGEKPSVTSLLYQGGVTKQSGIDQLGVQRNDPARTLRLQVLFITFVGDSHERAVLAIQDQVVDPQLGDFFDPGVRGQGDEWQPGGGLAGAAERSEPECVQGTRHQSLKLSSRETPPDQRFNPGSGNPQAARDVARCQSGVEASLKQRRDEADLLGDGAASQSLATEMVAKTCDVDALQVKRRFLAERLQLVGDGAHFAQDGRGTIRVDSVGWGSG